MVCSQTRITFHPLRFKYRVVSRSLFLFFSILSRQKSFFSKCFHRGYCHPCQKLLSKKTQMFFLWKTMSGLPLRLVTFVSNLSLTLLANSTVKSLSNRVPLDLILDITAERFSGVILSFWRFLLKFLPSLFLTLFFMLKNSPIRISPFPPAENWKNFFAQRDSRVNV